MTAPEEPRCDEEIRPMIFCQLRKGHDGPHAFGQVIDKWLAEGRLPGTRPAQGPPRRTEGT